MTLTASRHVKQVAPVRYFIAAQTVTFVQEWLTVSQRKLRLWESPLFEHWLSLSMYNQGHTWDER